MFHAEIWRNRGTLKPADLNTPVGLALSKTRVLYREFFQEHGEDEGDSDDGDALDMTEEEINAAKSALKDKVKDQSQVLLDAARDSVEDKVSRALDTG